ncbi:MAG TPA: hypothetical protein VKR24_13175 [Candidatus Limnocylindrales bacterium]|nr:hypothetical protein [Candidatus Limnocylindrales bacterium]
MTGGAVRPPDPGAPTGDRPRPGPGLRPGPGYRPARSGRRISPIWIAIAIALIGSLALVIYAFLKRDASQIPLLATAATIFGIVLVVAAAGGAAATYRAAREGRAGRAVVLALAGGFAAILAAGVLAFATILGLLYHP